MASKSVLHLASNLMVDELLRYTAMMQGTTVNRTPEGRANNAGDGRASMTSSSAHDQQRPRNRTGCLKVEGTDGNK
jgi:hypothetical protein